MKMTWKTMKNVSFGLGSVVNHRRDRYFWKKMLFLVHRGTIFLVRLSNVMLIFVALNLKIICHIVPKKANFFLILHANYLRIISISLIMSLENIWMMSNTYLICTISTILTFIYVSCKKCVGNYKSGRTFLFFMKCCKIKKVRTQKRHLLLKAVISIHIWNSNHDISTHQSSREYWFGFNCK